MADSALLLKKLGRYDITRVLGKGAMGVVYEARDPNLGRKVAIKTVRVDSLSKDEAADYELRFRTEAHSAARLQHPNIVSVYDSDRDGETAFLVMEFVKGEDLKHYLDSGQRYSLEQSVRMMRDLLSALEYAHQRKIIHRDIKPANLLIEADGRVKLTDFGVARIQDSGEATRTQGGMVGTLKYMSPEQIEGKVVDSASDLYSAGIVLYQLLTDRRPFDGDSYFSIVNQITNQQPPAPSSINPMLPTALDAVIARALAKNKSDRFATAQDFMVALQAAARRADPTITPSANPYKIIELHNAGALERSGSTASTLGNTSSTVTQELELVYWKDVKDSDDLVDLEGFLKRFPEGVYADLAKRRLKRMADLKAADGHSAYERTLVSSPSDSLVATPTITVSTDHAVEEITLTPAIFTPLLTGGGSDSESDAKLEKPKLPQDPQDPQEVALPLATAPIAPAAALARHKPMLWPLIAGAVLLTGLGLSWAVWQSQNKASQVITETSQEAGLPTAAVSAGSALNLAPSVSLSGGSSVTLVMPLGDAMQSAADAASTPAPNSEAVAAKAGSSSSKLSGAALKVATAARLKTAQEASAQSSAQSPDAQAAAPLSTTSASNVRTSAVAIGSASPAGLATAAPPRKDTPSGPKEACEGRSLFSYGACLYEQCERPAFKKHLYCVDQQDRQERARTNR